ncbi:MAG: hypothetical protein ACRYF0_00175 [Janthinobacterium lividum]
MAISAVTLLVAWSLCWLALLPACRWAPARPLPPATQTGAGTFGCFLNGEAWVPAGNNGRPNYQVTYDPGYRGGSLQIKVYRYVGPRRQVLQALALGAVAVAAPGRYALALAGPNGAAYTDYGRPAACRHYGEGALSGRTGTLVVSRLDLAGGVVAGTFAFQLAQPGCDTITVTQGRFDAKL